MRDRLRKKLKRRKEQKEKKTGKKIFSVLCKKWNLTLEPKPVF